MIFVENLVSLPMLELINFVRVAPTAMLGSRAAASRQVVQYCGVRSWAATCLFKPSKSKVAQRLASSVCDIVFNIFPKILAQRTCKTNVRTICALALVLRVEFGATHAVAGVLFTAS